MAVGTQCLGDFRASQKRSHLGIDFKSRLFLWKRGPAVIVVTGGATDPEKGLVALCCRPLRLTQPIRCEALLYLAALLETFSRAEA